MAAAQMSAEVSGQSHFQSGRSFFCLLLVMVLCQSSQHLGGRGRRIAASVRPGTRLPGLDSESLSQIKKKIYKVNERQMPVWETCQESSDSLVRLILAGFR